MSAIVLRIEGEFCGPMSIGTVSVIRAIHTLFGLSLMAAKDLVDRCVFDCETVTIPAPTREAARALLAEFSRSPAASRIHASIVD